MDEKHTITAKDKLIMTIVHLTIFVGVFVLGIVGAIVGLLD